ncbi:hypothetical protein ABT026_10770 [Streptomyces sp. NPDC002734]|uniref:hypothetical protein n=1 Tax=Streptomyces sp. NPDC002734 TaxID=3154426 RepID=UPI00332D4C2F
MSHATTRTAARPALAALSAVAAVAALAAVPAPAAGSPLGDHELRDRLTVTVEHAGKGLDGRYRLDCHPRGGDHPHAAAACARLDELTRPARPATAGPGGFAGPALGAGPEGPAGPRDPFAPSVPRPFCTMVDGGPATARITGWWDGRRVNAAYDRHDGCRTARWDAMVPVLPEIRAAR